MPRENRTYTCCICGRAYSSYKGAEECEGRHKIPERVDEPLYDPKDRKNAYPSSVLIHFKDGTSARYHRKKGS